MISLGGMDGVQEQEPFPHASISQSEIIKRASRADWKRIFSTLLAPLLCVRKYAKALDELSHFYELRILNAPYTLKIAHYNALLAFSDNSVNPFQKAQFSIDHLHEVAEKKLAIVQERCPSLACYLLPPEDKLRCLDRGICYGNSCLFLRLYFDERASYNSVEAAIRAGRCFERETPSESIYLNYFYFHLDIEGVEEYSILFKMVMKALVVPIVLSVKEATISPIYVKKGVERGEEDLRRLSDGIYAILLDNIEKANGRRGCHALGYIKDRGCEMIYDAGMGLFKLQETINDFMVRILTFYQLDRITFLRCDFDPGKKARLIYPEND